MGFLGPNGAGKTTTIRLLLDFLRPTRGRAVVLGLNPRRDKAALHRRIGYLPGDLSFPGRDRAGDLPRFFGEVRGGVAWSTVTDLADRLDWDLNQSVPLGNVSAAQRASSGSPGASPASPSS